MFGGGAGGGWSLLSMGIALMKIIYDHLLRGIISATFNFMSCQGVEKHGKYWFSLVKLTH